MYRPFHELHIPKGLISIIGSGGKTTFLRYLADHLDGSVILTTSTHIFPFDGIRLIETGRFLHSPDICPERPEPKNSNMPDSLRHEIRNALAGEGIVCLGEIQPSGKLKSPSQSISFEMLSSLADYCLVEADGSARHPLKAHRPWEPVIPACSSLTICLAGASGIGKPIGEACHCPDLFASIAGADPSQSVTAAHVAKVLNQENLADVYLISQIDLLPDIETAVHLCNLIRKDAFAVSFNEQ